MGRVRSEFKMSEKCQNTFKNIPLTWSDFKQKWVKQLNSQNLLRGESVLSLKCQKSVKKCNKEPLMQFCPDSKLVGTLSNNSLLNHLDCLPLYKKSPVFCVFFFFPVIDKVFKGKTQHTISHLSDQA